ncbi:MAG: TetR/AcrR family transcriptional regulator, transcriptional repressor for nem operon [Gammaproteobacteria bacterium]|jgi:TetR/AcrR family transcriptional repressor of nem operon|nr:TetR/AcrR family transcriptional regulator, transcriptional repressor for nem operon [Gammaproteobacteria bacterium]
MIRISNRSKIIANGLQVVLERGYVGASVRDIVEAAGVPQGSFTNHFVSKEAFSLEILDLYFANNRVVIGETLRNDALSPLKRLRAYLDASITAIRNHGTKNGCLVGNFAAEASDHSEIIRKRVSEIYSELREAVAYCLKAAVKAGELPKSLKINEVADFIVTGLQGAWLMSKVERDLAFAENFKKILFSTVLA